MEEKTMATKPETNNEVTENIKDDGRVELFVPRGSANDDPNFFIGINGKNYLLPRGKTSRVPKFVKDEYERSLRAQERYDETMDRLLGQKNNPTSLD
jgi:hypothetical protein